MTAMMRLLCSAIFFALFSSLAIAQDVATSDLHVTVKDPKSSMVTNATVTVRDVAKGLERTGTADVHGGSSVRLLPPGIYSVSDVAPGFTTADAAVLISMARQIADL